MGDRVKVYQAPRDGKRYPVLWDGVVTEPIHIDYYIDEARRMYYRVAQAISG